MNKATKRNVLASALLSIMLCVSLIAGATYALFTSESKVNVAVTSGKVDVVASLENLDLYSPTSIDYETKEITNAENAADNANGTFKNGGTAKIDDNTLTLTNVTPGDKATVTISVKNNSNVSVRYRTILACEKDNGLFAGLNVTINENETLTEYDGATKVSQWKALEAEQGDYSFGVAIELPSTAGNEYQGKTMTLSYTVEAVQGNADTEDPDPDTYYIYTANDLVNLGNVANRYDNVLLMKDIDMAGIAYTPFKLILNAKTFTFDGNGHTIKNFKPTGLTAASGNFSYNALIASVDAGQHESTGESTLVFKNLTMEAAEVKQAKGDLSIAAVLLAEAKAGCSVSIENCTVKNSTIESDDYAAALIGYGSGNFDWVTRKITNCTVENCTIKGNGNTAALMALENNTNTLTVTGASIKGNSICGNNGHSAAVLLGAGHLTATDVVATGNTISGGNKCNDDISDGTYGVFHSYGTYKINGTSYPSVR